MSNQLSGIVEVTRQDGWSRCGANAKRNARSTRMEIELLRGPEVESGGRRRHRRGHGVSAGADVTEASWFAEKGRCN